MRKDHCGIYGFFVDDKCVYVGSALKVIQRLGRHKRELIQGRHDNKHLQKQFDSLEDKSRFSSRLLIKVNKDNLSENKEELFKIEQHYQNKLLPCCCQLPAHLETASDAFKLLVFNNTVLLITSKHQNKKKSI